MIFEHNFLGRAGFYWFTGVVEDRKDPLRLGRVKVRCRGWHSENKAEVPTDHLPWAMVMLPTTSPSTTGISETPNFVEGSWVVGFFIDGVEAQEPLIMGTLAGIPQVAADAEKGFNDFGPTTGRPKAATLTYSATGVAVASTALDRGTFPYSGSLDKPDLSELTRNELMPVSVEMRSRLRALQQNIATAGHVTGFPPGAMSEPASAYAPVYPYNHATEYESGHVQEIDDTPTKERINLMHRTGTFTEMQPDGSKVDTVVADRYEFTHRNSSEHVDGEKRVTIDKGMRLLVDRDGSGGNLTIEVGTGSNFNIWVKGGNINLHVEGNVNETVTGNVLRTVEGNLTETIEGNIARTVLGGVTETITGALSVTANGITLTTPTLAVTGATTIGSTLGVSSTVTAGGDVTGAGISLVNHTHSHGDPAGTTSPSL